MPTPAELMKQPQRKQPYSGQTLTAVDLFERACKAEDQLARLLVAHENAAMGIPEQDRAWYIEQTEEIRRRYEAKQDERPQLYESKLAQAIRRTFRKR